MKLLSLTLMSYLKLKTTIKQLPTGLLIMKK